MLSSKVVTLPEDKSTPRIDNMNGYEGIADPSSSVWRHHIGFTVSSRFTWGMRYVVPATYFDHASLHDQPTDFRRTAVYDLSATYNANRLRCHVAEARTFP